MPKRNASTLTKRLIESAPTDSTIWDIQVPGFGVRVTEKGYRSFIFQYRSRAGGQGKMVIGRFPSMTVEEARKVARQHRTRVDGGGNPSMERQAIRLAPTMGDMIDYYTGEYAKTRALKPETAAEMRLLLDRFVRPTLGKRKVAEVQPADIRRAHGSARDAISPYRANKLLAGLSRICNLAVADEIRSTNPCFGIAKYPEDRRSKYFGQAEVLRLLEACDRYEDKQAANVLRLLLMTGARFREVLHATWDQFDLDNGLWVKPSHHTKTKIVHQVCLAETTVALLRTMETAMVSRYLFPGRSLNAPRADLKRPWRAILHDAGLVGFRIHDLRRTYASTMLSSGCDLSMVGAMLGHTQASTTQRYASLFTAPQREAANRTVNVLFPLRVVGRSKS